MITECSSCRLCKTARHLVFASGNPDAGVVVLGEAPGLSEDARGEPFVGRSGRLLRKLLAEVDLDETTAYFSNTVKCLPTDDGKTFRKPLDDEVAACTSKWTFPELRALAPLKVIVAVGGVAASAVLGREVRITEARGTVLPSAFCPSVVPILHPSYLLRQSEDPELMRRTRADLRLVRALVDASTQKERIRAIVKRRVPSRKSPSPVIVRRKPVEDLANVPKKFTFAPFPYFGGKRRIAAEVWQRLGQPKQYIEPFCGSAAVMLSAPAVPSLEVIGDRNFYVANFWRCIKFQPEMTAMWQDYPVSHVDLDARHRWLTHPSRTEVLRDQLSDPEWPGDAQMAGWWVWGQCAWIGSGWCEKAQIPHVTNAGQCVQSQIPHVTNAGQGVQSQIPHVTCAGQGVQSQIPHVTCAGKGVQAWFQYLARRLVRTRIIHGDWTRCLNHHYGGSDVGIFFDPPYRWYESLYRKSRVSDGHVADRVASWCREHADDGRIALCGFVGDYDLPGWEVMPWSLGKSTYGGKRTTESEAIWFSPSCRAHGP